MAAALDDSGLLLGHRCDHGISPKAQREMKKMEMEPMEMELGLDLDFDLDESSERTEEEQLVHDWRIEQLERLGLTEMIANEFASRVDWHDVADLVKQGCPPELALEILH
jgi:hypothetical protein